ncbi:MAG: M16 family metallopeptidase [Chloroflexota bacterium]
MKKTILTLIAIALIGASGLEAKPKAAKKPAKKAKVEQSTTPTPAPSKIELKGDPTKAEEKGGMPAPLPEKNFQFPKYTTHKLSNGIKVFLIEDNEQPTLAIRVLIPGGTSVEGQKVGVADMTTQLMTKGAGDRNALQIAETLEGVGANVSVSASGDYNTVYASSLKKHADLLFGVMSDVLFRPTFPKEEMEKLRTQFLAGVQEEKSRSGQIAAALSRVAVYGENHPYAARKTEKTIKALTMDDVMNYYKTQFKSDNATIAVIGDINAGEILPKLEKVFGKWEKGAPKIEVPPAKPMPLGVYFIPRAGSKQSSVIVTTNTVPRSSADYETIELAGGYMGGGFGGRLMRTLRETYSFTYTPFAYQTSSKYANRFTAGAEVRSDKTDSSVTVILEELTKLAQEGPSDADLNRTKRNEVGQYRMAFESGEYVASLIQNADFLGLPLASLESYPSRVSSMTTLDVKRVADRYINPRSAYVVVVGSPELGKELEKFGKVYEYNLDIEPQWGERAKMENAGVTVEELLAKYAQAIGGKQNIDAVSTIVEKSTVKMSMQGQEFSGKAETVHAQGKYHYLLELPVFTMQQWVNGSEAWAAQGPEVAKLEGDELETMKQEAIMFRPIKLAELGYKCEVKGKKDGLVVLKAVSPNGKEEVHYFDAASFLLTRTEATEQGPNGPITTTYEYGKYMPVGSVKMPTEQKVSNPFFTINSESTYEINAPVDDSQFKPANN